MTPCVLSDTPAPVRGRLPVCVAGAELTALRRLSESEFEARVFNGSADSATVRLTVTGGRADIVEVDLRQRPVPNGLALGGAREAAFTLRPWQLLTLRLAGAGMNGKA